ncbi:MAG: preprotein translocase subunit SecE [Chloroflexi bacterium]|nr:preprotein translocase subunit SecE [Chloroflexota bacterium]
MARAPLREMFRRHPAGEPGARPGVRQFFGEVVSELKKVTWPTREETTRLTLLVIAVSAAIGLALGLIDVGFNRLFEEIVSPRAGP